MRCVINLLFLVLGFAIAPTARGLEWFPYSNNLSQPYSWREELEAHWAKKPLPLHWMEHNSYIEFEDKQFLVIYSSEGSGLVTSSAQVYQCFQSGFCLFIDDVSTGANPSSAAFWMVYPFIQETFQSNSRGWLSHVWNKVHNTIEFRVKNTKITTIKLAPKRRSRDRLEIE